MKAVKSQPTPEPARLAFLTFSLGDQLYALPIDDVVEVAAMVALVQVAGAPPEVMGMANRHGQVLPVLDLRRVFRQGEAGLSVTTLFIVAQHNEQQVGLVVDEVHQVEYFDMTQVAHTSAREQYTRGMIPYADRLVQIIALPALLAVFLPGETAAGADVEGHT
jgi:purine-binding chemotaxis protein CheW